MALNATARRTLELALKDKLNDLEATEHDLREDESRFRVTTIRRDARATEVAELRAALAEA